MVYVLSKPQQCFIDNANWGGGQTNWETGIPVRKVINKIKQEMIGSLNKAEMVKGF